MSMIKTFNRAVSQAVNRNDETYRAMFGSEDAIPEVTIEESSDFNSGALANELEFLRAVSNYYIQSFDLDVAQSDNLDELVSAFVNLPRRNRGEEDQIFRNRFRSIVVQQTYPRRTNRWAIIQAISHFIDDLSTVQIIENFDNDNMYFEIRIEGGVDFDTALFLDDIEQGYVEQNYIGGEGIGPIITYLGTIVERIKASGVDFDIVFIRQDRFTKTSATNIGSVQKYLDISAWVQLVSQSVKTIDAQVI
jgi:hypothetical protein